MKRTLILLAFTLLPALAAPQAAQPWDTNVVAWDLPTTCTSGQPIANCPITSITIERATSPTGAFTAVASLAANAVTYTNIGVPAGQNCYRVIVQSAQGPSGPSNVACKTNVQPSGPPNPATNLRIVAPPAAVAPVSR